MSDPRPHSAMQFRSPDEEQPDVVGPTTVEEASSPQRHVIVSGPDVGPHVDASSPPPPPPLSHPSIDREPDNSHERARSVLGALLLPDPSSPTQRDDFQLRPTPSTQDLSTQYQQQSSSSREVTSSSSHHESPRTDAPKPRLPKTAMFKPPSAAPLPARKGKSTVPSESRGGSQDAAFFTEKGVSVRKNLPTLRETMKAAQATPKKRRQSQLPLSEDEENGHREAADQAGGNAPKRQRRNEESTDEAPDAGLDKGRR
ncbi:hypothetical protein PG994_010134 [Apiospora phragmitis]|uniref:Uncharacterized protein n=1 Tax=Apiospora phragmitis TaxID=2905665 RepID=A0ABR1TP18_9PEZI